VTLNQGGSVIPTTVSLYDGDQGIQLLLKVPLATGTVYTINVTGVVDITGNAQSSFPSQSFTTGTGIGLVAPTVVSTNPTSSATNVPDNTTIQVVFNEAMDPASFDPNNTFTLRDSSNNVVPATITFSADYKSATLHPTANLTGGGAIYTMYVGWNSNPPLQDLSGNPGSSTNFSFTTH
jgi:Bacterial Ig-like domain